MPEESKEFRPDKTQDQLVQLLIEWVKDERKGVEVLAELAYNDVPVKNISEIIEAIRRETENLPPEEKDDVIRTKCVCVLETLLGKKEKRSEEY